MRPTHTPFCDHIQWGMKKLLADLYPAVFAYRHVCEVRLNLGRPVRVYTDRECHALPIVVDQARLDTMLAVACDYSVYTAASKMVQGFVPYRGGVRIGVAGLYTLVEGRLHSVSAVTGLVVRVAHAVDGCSNVLPGTAIVDRNILVLSPPFGGKTTFLRDLARRLGDKRVVVLIDERDELAAAGTLSVGDCTVLRGSPKSLVYTGVVRAMSPQCVVMDELCGPDDLACVRRILASGVHVVASHHARCRADLVPEFAALFDTIVTLSPTPAAGTVSEVHCA